MGEEDKFIEEHDQRALKVAKNIRKLRNKLHA